MQNGKQQEALHRADLRDYRPVPFWSWNDKLEPARLRAQIRAMKQAGMGGFFMHARGGLQTEYMSEDWFAAVAASVDEAEKQGMNAWCYDENGWPSGFAGGVLLQNPANWAHYLRAEHKSAFDPAALGVYCVEAEQLRRVTQPETGGDYLCVYDCTNHTVTDILNPRVVDKFLQVTHERYAQRFGAQFGHTVRGFFTDEPQYFRWQTAYTPVMLEEFPKHYGGAQLLDGLGALFADCAGAAQFRFRYWRLMNELYCENFGGRIARWCDAHGVQLTGHSIEESFLAGQMWCTAGVMPFYEYEHIPGMDWLGRGIGNELAPRQVSSAAQQLGKKHAITETFACAGWDVTPRELKRIAEWQYVNGINMMCHHLYPYEIRGQRKRDYPAFYSAHNPWTTELGAFNDYFSRLGWLLAESRERADVGVIHPMHAAYLTYRRDTDRASIAALEDSFAALIERLGAAGVGHHYIDERLLEKYGAAEGAALRVGACRYRTVVVPEMDSLDHTTAALLRSFCAQGGKLWLAGKAPTMIDGAPADLSFLQSNTTWDELCAQSPMADPNTELRCTYRMMEAGDFLFAVNLSADRAYDQTFILPARGVRRYDALHDRTEPVAFAQADGTVRVPLHLEPGDSVILFCDDHAPTAAPQPPVGARVPLPARMTLRHAENALTLDTAALSDDGVHFGSPMPVMALSEQLLRQQRNRRIALRYTFRADAVPAQLALEAEWPQAALTVNGQPVAPCGAGTLDPKFVRYEIAPAVRAGENELIFAFDYAQPDEVYRVFNGFYYGDGTITETLLNCLSYETDVEAVYLLGNFAVHSTSEWRSGPKHTCLTAGPFVLGAPVQQVPVCDLTTAGLPFMHGAAVLETEVTLRGGHWVLRAAGGRWQWIRVWVNGEDAGVMLLGCALPLPQLRPGRNALRLEVMASNRNLYGPHHCKRDPEPFGVGPDTFSMYGSWNGGESPRYAPDYAFVRFGVDGLTLECSESEGETVK